MAEKRDKQEWTDGLPQPRMVSGFVAGEKRREILDLQFTTSGMICGSGGARVGGDLW